MSAATAIGPALEQIDEEIWLLGPRPGRKAHNVIEWRETPSSPWQRSGMHWEYADVAFLNHACRYEKYRVVGVVLK